MFKSAISVEIPQIGTYVTFDEKMYVITQTSTYQEEGTQIVTKCTIWAVSDEGDITGEESITVKSDELTEI